MILCLVSLMKYLKGKFGTDVDVLILTKDKTYKYKAFSTYEVNPKDFSINQSMETVLAKSKIDFGVDLDLNGKFLSLYTCTDTSGDRTILHAYLVREV